MKKINKNTLILFIFLALFYNVVLHVYAQEAKLTTTKTEIEEKRGHVKKEIRKIKLLEKLETNKLYKNQQKLESAKHTLEKNKREYKHTQNEMEQLKIKLDKVAVEYNRHKEYTSKRLVNMFKHKRNSYIEFLLNSKDINAFIDRLYFENIIIAYDKKRLKETKSCAREYFELLRRIEIHKGNLEDSIEKINRQQGDIEDAIEKNKKFIEKLQTDKATWEKAEKDLERQSRAISQMINQQTKKTQKEGVSVTVTSGFVKPVSGKITSPYGSRIHPIFKKRIFHSGIDIGCPYGTPIHAANSGRVIFVGWYSGYGKVVIIDHGDINSNPTTTLYAHMSTYNVSQGQGVAKGQIIGKVGTTGYSTGPHLHFEVRQKGHPTNPLNFVR